MITEQRIRTWDLPKGLRDTLLFIGGLGGMIQQTGWGPPSPILVPAFLAMMGLPAVLRSDEKAASESETPTSTSEPTSSSPTDGSPP